MSTVYEIPLQPAAQVMSIQLGTVTHQLSLQYRDISEGGWILDIADDAGEPIVCGIPLVTGVDLLAQYSHLGIGGGLFVVTDGDTYAVPTYANLGQTAHLYWTMEGGPGLRVRFQVEGQDTGKPMSALVTITNLSDVTAQKIQKEYDKVVLQVGYGPNVSTIFEGQIIQKIGNGQETPSDTYFRILATSQQEAHSYGIINKALAAGHTYRDQVDACLEAWKPFGIVAGY
eukprot:gene20830-21542_t